MDSALFALVQPPQLFIWAWMYPNFQVATVNGWRPVFSPADLGQLHVQASNFIGSLREQKRVVWEEATVLNRVEPHAYYESILNRWMYPGIEFPYIKNNHGHSESPINNRIFGLFMSAGSVNKSPFGDISYEYRIKDLLPNIYNYHLYLADFYCTKKSPAHKITIVLCHIGHKTDLFCKNNGLIMLDWFDNPYFKVDYENKFHVAKGTGPGTVFIDLLHTMPLHLHMGSKRRITYTGRDNIFINHMKRLHLGRKSNVDCSKCSVRASTPIAWQPTLAPQQCYLAF